MCTHERFALLALSCLCLALAAGCGDCSWSSASATVVMDRQVEVRLPAPVIFEGAAIGKVVAVASDDSGHSSLTLCLDKDALDMLTRYTAFYLKATPVEDELVCEVLAPGDLPKDKELVFPGFSEYASFFAWQAENMFKEGMEDMLRMLEGAINQ